MADLVFIGLSRAGLEEAQRDRDRHAAQMSARIWINPPAEMVPELKEVVLEAISCDREWPTFEKP